MLTETQKEQYLKRLGIDPISMQTSAHSGKSTWLNVLHHAHLQSLPFENLDISYGREVELSGDAIFRKLIEERRGGFCYELNYGFYLLLSSLGFSVQLLSARVYGKDGVGQEFDHLMLLVDIEGERVIADVGFGDSFLYPVSLNGGVHVEESAQFRVKEEQGELYLLSSEDNKTWQPQYCFTLTPRKLDDFSEMASYHQTSPKSSFTQKSVCTIATQNGRVTLSDRKLITTILGEKSERNVLNTAEYIALLKKHFSVVLPVSFSIEDCVNTP
ncbi:arylamine N-acetyltransferase family protein [Vibrio penaeicida]|uniref:arylamine N-acetyltransferase family protein n=1 Tax=Vibrio penaeicida TaxID=104609 RepID=UPI000CE9DAC2|nr:arylamine N-acetyltransferase [Vibrio penaeicida]